MAVESIVKKIITAMVLLGIFLIFQKIITENNRMHYDTLNQCIASGGNVVPSPNGGTSMCIKK